MAGGVNDYSASNHQFITTGNAFVTTAQSKFGGASLDLITAANTSNGAYTNTQLTDFNFGAGQFTCEAWVYWTSHVASNFEAILTQYGLSGLGWWLGMDNTASLGFYYSTTGSNSPEVAGSYTPTLNSWTHIAVDRDASNVLRLYANGVVIQSATLAVTLFASSNLMYIGNDQSSPNRRVPGYIDECRISNIARYGGAFTPPSAPYTADANTVLLVHFDRGDPGSIARNVLNLQPALQPGGVSTGAVGGIARPIQPYNGNSVSGNVQVSGVATGGLLVRAYAKATGELIGRATTDGSGNYSIKCGADWADVTVIAYDPTTYQAIVYDRVTPA